MGRVALIAGILLLPSLSLSKGKQPDQEAQDQPLSDPEASETKVQEPQPADVPIPETTRRPSPERSNEQDKTPSEKPLSDEAVQERAAGAEKSQEPKSAAQRPAGTRTHTVWIWQETKDCLWRLAKQYYGDPWQWKKIYLANRNNILDPNLIFPKQKITIPPAG